MEEKETETGKEEIETDYDFWDEYFKDILIRQAEENGIRG